MQFNLFITDIQVIAFLSKTFFFSVEMVFEVKWPHK